MDVQLYRQAHLDLLVRSANCSRGQTWVWQVFGQCLEDVHHVVGFILGLVAVPLWAGAHLCLYDYLRRRTRSPRQRNVCLFVSIHLVSGILGLVGACLAPQLVSQIIFAVFVTTVAIGCCVYTYISSGGKKKHKQKLQKNNKLIKGRSLFSLCLYPVAVTSSCLVIVTMTTSTSRDDRDVTFFMKSEDNQTLRIPVVWMVGYGLGTMAGVLHVCCKFIDIFDAYITVESGGHATLAYMLDMSGDLCYVVSVVSQSQTLAFIWHSLPWTLPRLISAGLDIGIMLQRLIIRRRGKRRTLSDEDASRLLSDDGSEFLSDGSEEVIWMPLKCVESAAPTHPVCASRVQILSESDVFSDSIDFCDSRRQSIIADDNSPIPEESHTTDYNKYTETEDEPTSESENEIAIKKAVAKSPTLQARIAKLNTVTSTEKTTSWIHTNSDVVQGGCDKEQ